MEAVLRQALEAVSVRMADGRRDVQADYCEGCQGAGLHGSQRQCGCWCHRARALLEEAGAPAECDPGGAGQQGATRGVPAGQIVAAGVAKQRRPHRARRVERN